MEKIKLLEEKIQYIFKDKELLTTAFTHTSYTNETDKPSYERLEFLGDSILGCITAQNLYKMFPESSEGELSKNRAELVCEQSLASLTRKLGLTEFLLLGVGEEKNNGRMKDSILADSFEALLAAIYLDSDFETAMNWLNTIMPPEKYDNYAYRDWKALLQDKFGEDAIDFKIIDHGPEEPERFNAQVYIHGKADCVGSGTTKKSAIQQASKKALNKKRRG